ncbi:RraA family protein [Planctomicrobium sp. SH664]|uniref:RraA family protein n=1 Tax=Planctomicrobium sp. SH664 TaxID=3448125 RepID=UPI003F5C91E8
MSHDVTEEILDGFRRTATPLISDNLDRVPGALGIRPFHNCTKPMVGRALTVKTQGGDNLFIHKALQLVKPGDVIVVDGGGAVHRALIGEIMVAIAASRGAAGFVLDGAIRDSVAIADSDFPCFARTVIHLGPYKNGPGEINVPVSIGGMVVNPGDIVVGDADGVVAFSPVKARDLLAAVHAQEVREAEILLSIRENRYTDVYSKPAASK